MLTTVLTTALATILTTMLAAVLTTVLTAALATILTTVLTTLLNTPCSSVWDALYNVQTGIGAHPEVTLPPGVDENKARVHRNKGSKRACPLPENPKGQQKRGEEPEEEQRWVGGHPATRRECIVVGQMTQDDWDEAPSYHGEEEAPEDATRAELRQRVQRRRAPPKRRRRDNSAPSKKAPADDAAGAGDAEDVAEALEGLGDVDAAVNFLPDIDIAEDSPAKEMPAEEQPAADGEGAAQGKHLPPLVDVTPAMLTERRRAILRPWGTHLLSEGRSGAGVRWAWEQAGLPDNCFDKTARKNKPETARLKQALCDSLNVVRTERQGLAMRWPAREASAPAPPTNASVGEGGAEECPAQEQEFAVGDEVWYSIPSGVPPPCRGGSFQTRGVRTPYAARMPFRPVWVIYSTAHMGFRRGATLYKTWAKGGFGDITFDPLECSDVQEILRTQDKGVPRD
jgi:hypothetical protein